MVSISDLKILENGWINQLRLLSRNTVLRNVDTGELSLVENTPQGFHKASSEFMISCKNITTSISSIELRKRIAPLQKTGDILDTSSVYDKLESFMISGENAEKAFNEARKRWHEKGAQDRSLDIEVSAVSVTSAELHDLSAKCFEMLLDKFPERD